MFNLTGKIAVVTGAASGIGAAIAERLAEAGAHVIVVDRNPIPGEETVDRIRKAGHKAEFAPVDVSVMDSCRTLPERLPDGRCDVLVNNAGIGHVGTVLTTLPEDLDRLYAVNVKGVMHMSQVFLPGMIARRSGSIINLASIGGVIAIRDRFAYCATKFAVVGMTKAMALDHAESQVRVNCICPGRVETPFVQARLKEYPDPQKAYAEMAATQALGRMATPDEIAAAALYLAADESAFVTGSAMIVDGGWTAGK
jgi:NAD(P)-dependent dehydrogenase (short-subunit alcohol dehydrogenase family)